MNDTLKLEHITRSFGKGNTKLEILKDINLTIKPGEIVALVGPSGSGKSTLLHIAGLLDTPTSGCIEISGQNASKMNDSGRTKLRQKTIGFVYQSHLLLPDFNALENDINRLGNSISGFITGISSVPSYFASLTRYE